MECSYAGIGITGRTGISGITGITGIKPRFQEVMLYVDVKYVAAVDGSAKSVAAMVVSLAFQPFVFSKVTLVKPVQL